MMTLQQLLSHTRKAVDTFSMIEDGDRIAIGVSGGKDSLTLALALKGLQRFYPKHFELQAFTISLGFPGTDFSPVADFMAAHDIPYQVIESDIGEIVFEQRKEKNPCALCAKMRKGAFNDAAKAAGCNKVALGHHKEDAVETFLMSLLYEGRINTFSPVTYWDRIGLYSIRPLLFVSEQDIVYFCQSESSADCQKSLSGQWVYQARRSQTAASAMEPAAAWNDRPHFPGDFRFFDQRLGCT